ncbi:MAG: hypothetical protein WBO45_26070 [Planctomycetota bacterium]
MFDHPVCSPRSFVLAGALLFAGLAAPLPLAPADAAEPASSEEPFKLARIYWEYNASANDLGVHVTLDAEDWKRLRIEKPGGQSLFEVRGRGPYQQLGMTELFFEGAEPSLSQVPLATLLGRFPEGLYCFEGVTVDGGELESEVPFSHAVPAGPVVSAVFSAPSSLTIHWDEVTTTPPGFPVRPLTISGYQVICGSFQVTLPPTARSVTVPPEFVASLPAGENPYEVLAIEQSANQTLTEGVFVK